MKLVLAVWWLVLVIGFGQCNRSPNNPQSPILGLYGLSAQDKSGRLVFTGRMSLTSLEQNHLKGQCTIVREKNAPEGLHNQSGGCEGLIEGKKISIDSAPSLDDAGLLLDGQFDDDRITGTWRIDGFVTSDPLGKFEAIKKE